MLNFSSKNLKLFSFLIFTFCFTAYYWYSLATEHYKKFKELRRIHWDLHREVANIGVKEYPVISSFERKDWHDYEFMRYEASRKGLGEQGEPVILTDPDDIELDNKLEKQEGVHAVVSDRISVNRSLRDTRPQECMTKKYLKDLPRTSVIVIFYNEWPSILKRTLHSIYNRTPRELLHELIVVNDNSSMAELDEPLARYIEYNFDTRVKFLRLKERCGLIVTRMKGAELATGEVLVFLDAHMEVNVNWLPPLLEEIVISPTTVTTPVIDSFDRNTMSYRKGGGSRGVFDDIMWYKWFPLREVDKKRPYLPYQMPIMLGCAIVIRRDYFFDLGQYDEGLQIWNGEQIELSLKLHLCGGNLLEVPCSRMSHFFRTTFDRHQLPGIDVAARNFKRVAEVWMDDYKNVMYEADPQRLGMVDPGDLTKARLVKDKLKCKPFQYFLEKIAPEMYTRFYYQLHYPGYFAVGAIQSNAFPDFCLDLPRDNEKIQLYKCNDRRLIEPGYNQFFKLTWHRKLRLYYEDDCLEDDLKVRFCHYSKAYDFQNWKYDIDTKQLISLTSMFCLTAASDRTTIDITKCNATDLNQKWTWGKVNETMLKQYEKVFFANETFLGFDAK